MKNIYILPTDKQSKLCYDKHNNLVFDSNARFVKPDNKQHIYITSDEEIKVEDYITDGYKVWQWKDDSSLLGRKKIILTTDQDLIKDNVQAIDDEFLEWFVKNPSCEFVEVQNQYRVKSGTIQEHKDGLAGYEYYEYKIIIPKEEPKTLSILEIAKNITAIGIDKTEPK